LLLDKPSIAARKFQTLLDPFTLPLSDLALSWYACFCIWPE
jgi:hypothetical protein